MKQSFKVAPNELKFEFTRGGGPGGQNKNKVATVARVIWDFMNSKSINYGQKMLLRQKLNSRIGADGRIFVERRSERYQHQNRKLAVESLNQIVEAALKVPKKRIPTKPPKSAKEKRLKEKKKQSEKKSLRHGKIDE